MTIDLKERVYLFSRVSALVQEELGIYAAAACEFVTTLENALNVNPEEHLDIVIEAVCHAKGIPTKESYSCENLSYSDKTELKQIVQKCMNAVGVTSVQQSVIMSGVDAILD